MNASGIDRIYLFLDLPSNELSCCTFDNDKQNGFDKFIDTIFNILWIKEVDYKPKFIRVINKYIVDYDGSTTLSKYILDIASHWMVYVKWWTDHPKSTSLDWILMDSKQR